MAANFAPLSGVIPPMITPLTAVGEIDKAGLERLVNDLLADGVSGVFLLGSSGEGPWLTAVQQQTLVRETVRLVDGRVPVLAGALEPGTARALEAVHRHVDSGADAVVIASPYYFEANEKTQIRHIETLANQSPVPVMLYNIPQMTHNPISPATVEKVAGLDNLIGVKDSAGNWENFLALVQLREKHSGFVVFQGAEKLAAQSMLAGADGIVAGLANLVPDLFDQIVRYSQSGSEMAVLQIQEKINHLWTLHAHGYWLACLKYAGSLLGYGSGAACGQWDDLSDTGKGIIRQLLGEIKGEL